MFGKRSKPKLQFTDIIQVLEDRAKSESYRTTLLELSKKNNWKKNIYEQNYENLVNICECIQKENDLLAKLKKQIHYTFSPKSETISPKNLRQVLGIDLGTSKSTVGVYKINSRGRVEIDIISNKQGERSNPSVVFIGKDKTCFGKEAIKASIKCPQNLIYDTKRMLGRKFDDPFIQKMRNYWTFKTLKSDNGGILIEVDGYQYEPYEISGMILNNLMVLANDHLREPTNYAIITIPANFTELQKEETKKAAKSAGLKLLELVEEPKAAAFCYGYKSNNAVNGQKERDIFIYDIGGGTLDVSYVEVKGSSFKILATACDPFLGGQDFTNCIFDYIAPFIDKFCLKTWRNEPRFVSYVKDECEKAKQYLACSDDCDIFIDIPTKLQKTNEITIELNLTKEQFENISHDLYERCMNPVKDVLKWVQRDPSQISGLVLIGGSSFLPKIRSQLKEITGKEAYHGVSPIEAVAFGACTTSIKYCEESLVKEDNKSTKNDINNNFLSLFSVKEVAPATIEIQKIKDKVKYYYTMIEEGAPLPFSKEALIYSNDVEYSNYSNEIIIPVLVKKGGKRTLLGNIKYEIPQRKNNSNNVPLVKIKLRKIVSNLFYSTNDPSTEFWSSEKPLEENKNVEQICKEENQNFNRVSYHHNIQDLSSQNGINFQIGPPVKSEKNFQMRPLVVQEKNVQNQSPIVQEANYQREVQILPEQNAQIKTSASPNIIIQKDAHITQVKSISMLPQIVQKTNIQKEAQEKMNQKQHIAQEMRLQMKEKNLYQKQTILSQNPIYQTPKTQETKYQFQSIAIPNQVEGNQNQIIENQNHNFYLSFPHYQNLNSSQQQYPFDQLNNQYPSYNQTFYDIQPNSQNYDHISMLSNLGHSQETFQNNNQSNMVCSIQNNQEFFPWYNEPFS